MDGRDSMKMQMVFDRRESMKMQMVFIMRESMKLGVTQRRHRHCVLLKLDSGYSSRCMVSLS